MDVAEEIRRFYENVSARRWSDTGGDPFAPDMRVHVPAIGVEATSWEEGLAGVRAFVESVDARYQVDDLVQHGRFVVVFLTATGTLDGQRATWSVCTVHRMDDGKVVETWTLRGSDPAPVDAG